MEWEVVTDPVEQAFTIEMPKGWKNTAYLRRDGIVATPIVTATSPDGQTSLFIGDTKLPKSIEPWGATPFLDANTQVRAFMPAPYFLPDYIPWRFGGLPGFRITGVGPAPEIERRAVEGAQRAGAYDARVTAAELSFEYQQDGKTVKGLIYGMTASIGMVWFAELSGISGSDDPHQYTATLMQMAASHKTSAEWQRRENQAAANRQFQHEQTMAHIHQNTRILQQNHQNNMATLHGMAASHQLRMDAIHAAGDASTAAYYQRDQASDTMQRGFLNYVTDEHTVATPNGQTFQVDNRYDRYFINKNDNTYIGVKGADDLNNFQGINPNDYEEAKIKR